MKIPHSFAILMISFLALAASSCKTQATIAHGSSFGHCRGFCNKELAVGKKETVYRRWENGELPKTKVVTVSADPAFYHQLIKLFNFEAFDAMEPTIGCPDCADGGAEWIEVRRGKRIKRVTFEYNHVPEKLQPVVAQLKKRQEPLEASVQ